MGGPVLGLENQSEGPGVMRDEEEANNGLSGRKRRDIVSIVLVTSGLITSVKKGYLVCCFVFVMFLLCET